MADLSELAKPAVEELLKSDEEQLYEQLGMRAKAIAEDPTKSSSFELQVIYDQAQMGLKEDVKEFGQRLFRRWNVEAYKLVCGSDYQDQESRESLLKAFSLDGGVAVAAAPSALLVTYLGLAPALAAVVAALLVKRFLRPTYEVFCEVWKEKLPKSEKR